MKDGNLIKEKKEFFFERLKTKEGIIDILIGSGIYGFVVINYAVLLYEKIKEFLFRVPQIPVIVSEYLAYLFFGLIMFGIGMLITVTIISVYRKVANK